MNPADSHTSAGRLGGGPSSSHADAVIQRKGAEDALTHQLRADHAIVGDAQAPEYHDTTIAKRLMIRGDWKIIFYLLSK